MTKGVLIHGALLMLAFTAYAGAGPWAPDFAPQCKRDENLRNNYLDAEQKAVENSRAEMDKRGFNIIPTPKNLAFAGKDLRVPLKELAGKITVLADKSAAIAVDMINKKLGQPVDVKELGAAGGATEITILLLRQDLNAKHPLLPADIPDFYQGYVIKTLEESGKRTYVLAGKDHAGLLYAAVTFCKLITAESEALVLPGVQASDWPDMRFRKVGGLLNTYRQNFMFSNEKSTASAKEFIDWLLDHKINMANVNLGGWDQLYFPYDEDGKKWLREVCAYAQERGVYLMRWTHSAVGDKVDNKDDAAFKDWACVEHLGFYYCWSNDDLLRKRAQKLAQHLKDMGLSGVFIHSVDTGNSKWQDRCPKCRERFGDDRFSGDAHVFNIYRDEIRKSFPEMPVIIVPRPYHSSVDDIRHVESGEMKSRDDLKRFAQMLREDVYICHRCETTRANNLTWVHTFKQRMNSCVMAWYIYPTLEGREFTPICRYYRAYNYPLADDVASLGVGGSASMHKLQGLGLAEYTWNLNSPGSAEEYPMTPRQYEDIWDPFGADLSKNKELQALVKRSCDDIFGKKGSKYFYNACLLFTDSNFVENYQEVAYALRQGEGNGAMMPDIDDAKCAEFMRRNYQNAMIIINDMEAAKKETADPAISACANLRLMKFYPLRALAHVYMLTLEADQASRNGEHAKAAQLIEEAFKACDAEAVQLKADWLKFQGQKNEVTINMPPAAPDDLAKARNIMDMIRIKIQSRALIAKRKQGGAAAVKEMPRVNKPIKAAVFAPDLKGGLTYGRTGLVNLLKGINDISVTEIDNLALDTMKQYDCVVFPDCKSLGEVKANVNDIRAYVVDLGGGMYFEHDSCGFNRFPLKDSVFPELAHVADRVGEPTFSTKYKASDRTLKIVKQHPATEGSLIGATFEQVYFDHLQLINETGELLVEDSYGKGVVVAGQAGNGRVVFNGGLTLNAVEDKELDKPLATVEGEIIVNSVRWLAKDKKGTELIMADLQKTDKTLTDREASVITFTPQVVPCQPLHEVVLSAQCFNVKDLRPISPRIEIAMVDAITEKWEADGKVIINADSYPSVRVVMELSSREGRGAVVKIMGNK